MVAGPNFAVGSQPNMDSDPPSAEGVVIGLQGMPYSAVSGSGHTNLPGGELLTYGDLWSPRVAAPPIGDAASARQSRHSCRSRASHGGGWRHPERWRADRRRPSSNHARSAYACVRASPFCCADGLAVAPAVVRQSALPRECRRGSPSRPSHCLQPRRAPSATPLQHRPGSSAHRSRDHWSPEMVCDRLGIPPARDHAPTAFCIDMTFAPVAGIEHAVVH